MIVIGGSPAALSLAAEAQRAGTGIVPVLVPGELSVPLEAMTGLSLRHVRTPLRVTNSDDGGFLAHADSESFLADVAVLDVTTEPGPASIPWPIPESLRGRVHTKIDFDADDRDVLVVGDGDAAAVACWRLVEERARVVLCLTGATSEVSRIALRLIEDLEREQRATILWRSSPDAVVELGGFPMAVFPDRRTPDLQFDHVLVTGHGSILPPIEWAEDVAASVFLIAETVVEGWPGPVISPAGAWSAIRSIHFPELPDLGARSAGFVDEDRARDLARTHYNATITNFDTAHSELWRLRLRPDHEAGVHRAGQYCSLGVGLWEPRADDAAEPELELNREKLVRRSYSISSPIFDEDGYLADPTEMDEIELYIVWVRSEQRRIPSLTPRLALKRPGDRVYLGPKVAGRYTLNQIKDPSAQVLFCATGTGEAPHNAMVVELLRKGHYGPIVSAVSVRYLSDLAYLEEHRRLEERFANYRYLPNPTREPEVPKRYLQDLLEDGILEEALGGPLDPITGHVYLCGNPVMIGLPDWDDAGHPSFPTEGGMAELLHHRGLTIDRRGVSGNVHYEEYW